MRLTPTAGIFRTRYRAIRLICVSSTGAAQASVWPFFRVSTPTPWAALELFAASREESNRTVLPELAPTARSWFSFSHRTFTSGDLSEKAPMSFLRLVWVW